MTAPDPGSILRRSLLAWGAGHLALGETQRGAAWLAGELLGLALVGAASATLGDTTWYLVPFLLGCAFLVAWIWQAVAAYRLAAGRAGDGRSTPAAIAWLGIPILLWGTGFWLLAGDASSPGAVLDRFLTAWPEARSTPGWGSDLSGAPAQLRGAAVTALTTLDELCTSGERSLDCGPEPNSALRDVRVRIVDRDATRAEAVAELVSFERRPTRFLGLFAASELVPVPQRQLITLDLAAQPATLPGGLGGPARWSIVNARSP